ncbi:MAG: sensor histidine kinase, partial [Alphaproteobacteria bacterium]
LSHLERGEVQWQLDQLDPEDGVTRALAACEGLARDAGVIVERLPCEAPVTVSANMDRLCQVLINLISNAIKYNTSANPVVVVSSTIVDGEYRVLVEDNGPGIAQNDQTRVFNKFSRGWQQNEHGRAGAGLGLAISWEIMRDFGGRLDLVSSSPEGSCFAASMPLE